MFSLLECKLRHSNYNNKKSKDDKIDMTIMKIYIICDKWNDEKVIRVS